MTVPQLTQEQLLKLLADHGWVEVSNTDWETHKRIMIGNGKESFPLQLKKDYYFNHVVKLCESIGIPAPEDHQICYDQYKEYKSKNKEQEPGEE